MFAALFTAPTVPLPKPRERVKRHHSKCISEGEDACARKKEHTNLEAVRRDSLFDEEARHMRARNLATGMSSFRLEVDERSTTEGTYTSVDTTYGVCIEVSGSGKPDLPTY